MTNSHGMLKIPEIMCLEVRCQGTMMRTLLLSGGKEIKSWIFGTKQGGSAVSMDMHVSIAFPFKPMNPITLYFG